MNPDEAEVNNIYSDEELKAFDKVDTEERKKEKLKEMNAKYKDSNALLNTRINSFLILKIEEKPVTRDKKRTEKFAFCRCDCSEEKWIRLYTILNGRSRTCGCGNYKARLVDPTMRTVRHVMTYYSKSAKKVGRKFELTYEDIKALIFKPCFYCGSNPVDHASERVSREGKYATKAAPYNGMDRIDSSKGYFVENIVPCCTHCNTMKLDLSLEEFKDHVARVHTKININMKSPDKLKNSAHFKYYDGMVILNDYMGGDLSVANAARVSFNKKTFTLTEKDEKLIKYLADHKHMSPFRHVQFQIILQGIPEFILRQLYKHQVGMSYTAGDFREAATVWNEVSGRYVEFDIDFFDPVSFRVQHEKNKQGSHDRPIPNENIARELYKKTVKDAWDSYQALLNMGVCKEQARMVLPLSFKTSVMWTASLEGLAHFVKLRNHEGAQKEIQEIAIIVEKIIRNICPISSNALLGPELIETNSEIPIKVDTNNNVKLEMPSNISEIKQLPPIG